MGATNRVKGLHDRRLTADRRASERVREYLLAEFEQPAMKHGTRLPPIRELATHIKVSARTVHGAIQRLAREGRVRTEHGSGTYLIETRRAKADRLTFAVGLPAPGSPLDNPWYHGIYGGMLSAALRSSIPISFLPGCRDSMLDADVRKALLEQRPQVDGLILFPFHRDPNLYEEVRSAYERDGKPVVTLNPPSETATTNFVSPDYLGASHQLGKAWKQTGRGRVILLIGPSFKTSTSARLRWAGLINAFGKDLGGTINCRALQDVDARGAGVPDPGYCTIRDALAKGTKPDAIYTAGDYAALGAMRALREAGLRVPEDVSVVGGTGLDLTGSICPQLTRMWQPLATMGEKMVEMLTQRIELGQPAANSVSGIYLPAPFVGGVTTRAEENALLGIPASTGN